MNAKKRTNYKMTNLINILYGGFCASVVFAAQRTGKGEEKWSLPFTAFTKDFRFFIITSTSVTDFGVHLLIVKIYYCLSDPNSIPNQLQNTKRKEE